jgi:hypothetical protein
MRGEPEDSVQIGGFWIFGFLSVMLAVLKLTVAAYWSQSRDPSQPNRVRDRSVFRVADAGTATSNAREHVPKSGKRGR